MVLQNVLATISPEFWQFGVGLILVAVVLLARRGLVAMSEDALSGFGRLLPRGKHDRTSSGS
jgi:ABC-type branched-subunit amino acid transport system permease subunit